MEEKDVEPSLRPASDELSLLTQNRPCLELDFLGLFKPLPRLTPLKLITDGFVGLFKPLPRFTHLELFANGFGSFRKKNEVASGRSVKCYATFFILFGLSAFDTASSATLREYCLDIPCVGPDFYLPCQDVHIYTLDSHESVLDFRETDRCEQYYKHQVTERHCQGYDDSVYCGHPDYDAVLHKDGVYICQEKPIHCGHEEYLRISNEQFTSCPANTCRPEIGNNNTECLPCLDTDEDLIINGEVVRACNTTHATLIECKQGFFRNVNLEDWQLSEEDGLPCQTYQFVGRNCTRLQDTVGCPSPYMVVSDILLRSNRLIPNCKNSTNTKTGSFKTKKKQAPETSLKFNQTFLIILGLCALLDVSSAALPLVCRQGYYLHTPRIGPDFCLPCQDGSTYIPVDLHSYRQCWNCTKVVNPETEVLVKECNKYRDSKIICKSGFYRRLARNSRETDTCQLCKRCQVTTRPCQGYHDSLCCRSPNYDAFLNKDGVYICKEKPIRCGRGEYLKPYTEQCVVCPANTYRPETDHNETECLPCLDNNRDSIKNRQVVRACNTTHPALFECKQGFYRNVSREDWRLTDEDCLPCQTCQFFCQNCTRLQDTVCCQSYDVVVSESPLQSNFVTTEGQATASTTADSKIKQWTDSAEFTGKPLSDSSSNSRNTQDDTVPHLAANSIGLFEIFLVIVCLVMAGFHVFIHYYKHICWEILPDPRNKFLCLVELMCFISSILILTISVFCVVVNVDKKMTTLLNISTIPLLAVSVFIAFYKTYQLKAFILSQKRETNVETLLPQVNN